MNSVSGNKENDQASTQVINTEISVAHYLTTEISRLMAGTHVSY
jgi:hypothetical protein